METKVNVNMATKTTTNKNYDAQQMKSNMASLR